MIYISARFLRNSGIFRDTSVEHLRNKTAGCTNRSRNIRAKRRLTDGGFCDIVNIKRKRLRKFGGEVIKLRNRRLFACGMALCMLLPVLGGCGKSPALSDKTLYVRKVESLSDDFIMGCDVSSVLALERAGVQYYDYNGKEADLFKVLAESGVNTIRVRVWNDPYDADGNGYGGGSCDAETAAEIGKRAAAAGLKLLVDFHYSDFWADPGKQMVPKAWDGMEIADKSQALYDYTCAALDTIIAGGADISMVQLGNETNGMMSGEKIWMNIYYLMEAGSRAVREKLPGAKIAVHFTNPESTDNLLKYASKLDYYHLDYDVFASSYYPYWHGTTENLTEVLRKIGDTYDKQVMCMETSYAYTLEDGDGFGNSIGDVVNYEKPYPFTVQGQSREIADVIAAVAEIGARGIGVCYWEPAWLPVPGDSYEARQTLWEQYGAGWASSYSAAYDPDDAGEYYGGSSWDNQALFDFAGHPLPSLKTFALVRTGNAVTPVPDAIRDTELTVRLGETVTLPDTVHAIYTDGSEQEIAVTWESADLAAMSAGEPQTYTIKGTAGDMETICRVAMVAANYVDNYSFEDADRSMWQIENVNDKTTQIDFQERALDAVTGDFSLHFWGETGTDFIASQEIAGMPAGTYRFSLSIQGGFSSDDDSQDITIFCKVGDKEYSAPASITKWAEWSQPEITGISVAEGDKVTVGVHVSAGAQSWGTVDDVLFNPQK